MTRISRLLLVALLAAFLGCSDAANHGDDPGATFDAATADAAVPPVAGDSVSNPGVEDAGTTASDAVTRTAPDAMSPEDVAEPPTGDTAEGPCGECFHPAVCLEGVCVMPEAGGCTPGETGDCYSFDAVMTCDATGTAFLPVLCPDAETCDAGQCKLLICEPDSWVCQGVGAKKQCAADGSGFGEPINCPDGEYCANGKCAGSCAPDPKFGATVGCAFWTVDLPNYPDAFSNPTPEDLPHALVVSNPGEEDAEVSFEPPPGVTVDVTDPVVPAGESRVFLMPVLNVSDSGITPDGILMTATRPVLAHQFNPWDNKASNDASLLIPEPFLGKKYVVLSWPTTGLELLGVFGGMPNQAGYFTVVATQDDTQVTIKVTATTKAGPGLLAMNAGNIQTVTLNRGDVLNVEAEPTSLLDLADLSGSTISANKPVAAFGGHEEAVVADSQPSPGAGAETHCCADHLEEQLLPISALDADYVAVKAKPRGSERDIWRIQAAEANVTITTIPPIEGLDGVTLASKGDWVEGESDISFEVHGTGPLQLGQYLVSQTNTDDNTGDPSLILAIPAARYRDAYVLMVPDDYSTNWITIIKTTTTTVNVDGTQVAQSEFTSIGGGDWEFGYVELAPGVHEVDGDETFGVVAYGFNSAVSYGYPGGMSAPSE
ncbi:MAG: IgGFc-binding protein [Myxococcota bacterium]